MTGINGMQLQIPNELNEASEGFCVDTDSSRREDRRSVSEEILPELIERTSRRQGFLDRLKVLKGGEGLLFVLLMRAYPPATARFVDAHVIEDAIGAFEEGGHATPLLIV